MARASHRFEAIPMSDAIEVSEELNAILSEYSEEVAQCVERGVRNTMRTMKSRTKRTAPVDDGRWEKPNKYGKGFPNHRAKNGKSHGEFERHIASKSSGKGFEYNSTWYVKGPEYRLTHLLVHGHRKFIFGRDTGERVHGDDFLHVARDEAEEKLEKSIKKYIEEVSR